ncbi:MAG: hypothetical protein IKS33_09725 [Bacteroidales bacterium]|nr:hypothetical protein [Bacteroidales bacterium]
MEEKLIVSLTSYGKRLNNLPVVLDTIYAQTLLPDLVVLNLAYEEILPKEVEIYLRSHNVEINRVLDTKVYKKIVPTLKRYPNDCVICIDDDWLYPKQMIEDFVNVHKKYPHNPISGNRIILFGMQCHCGCASLVKKEYFGEYLDLFDNDIYVNCKSSDVFYTYCATKNNKPYVRTQYEYFLNMKSFNSIDSYSDCYPKCYVNTFDYLVRRFDPPEKILAGYLCLDANESVKNIVNDIEDYYIHELDRLQMNYTVLSNSKFVRLRNFILFPFIWLKKMGK